MFRKPIHLSHSLVETFAALLLPHSPIGNKQRLKIYQYCDLITNYLVLYDNSVSVEVLGEF